MLLRNQSKKGFDGATHGYLDLTSMILEERGDPVLNRVDFALLSFGGYQTTLATCNIYKPGPIFEKETLKTQEQTHNFKDLSPPLLLPNAEWNIIDTTTEIL